MQSFININISIYRIICISESSNLIKIINLLYR